MGLGTFEWSICYGGEISECFLVRRTHIAMIMIGDVFYKRDQIHFNVLKRLPHNIPRKRKGPSSAPLAALYLILSITDASDFLGFTVLHGIRKL